MELTRGRVYLANLADEGDAAKPWIVVSRNSRNKAFGNALAVRVTTTNKYTDLPSVTQLPDRECIHGWVRGDELTTIWVDEVDSEIGGLSRPAMQVVEAALLGALGIGI